MGFLFENDKYNGLLTFEIALDFDSEDSNHKRL